MQDGDIECVALVVGLGLEKVEKEDEGLETSA